MIESKMITVQEDMFKSQPPMAKKNFLSKLWQYLCSSNEERFSNQEISREQKKTNEIESQKNMSKDKEIASYIEAEMLSMVLDIVNNGYALNKYLQRKFDEKVIKILVNLDTNEMIEIHKKGYVMKQDILIKSSITFLKENSQKRYSFMREYDKNHSLLIFIKENYLHLLNNKMFAKELISELKNQINIQNKLSKDLYTIESKYCAVSYYYYMKNIFYNIIKDNIDFKEYLNCALKMKEISESTYEEMKKDILKNKNHINNIVDSFKDNSLNEKLKQKVVSNAVIEANKFNTQNLPKESKKIIQEIETKLRICDQYKSQVSDIKWVNINRLVEDKLPMIIKKYLSLDEEDLATLKNIQGQSPYEILNSSLNNILYMINDTVKEIKQQSVNDLSVLHRYTQEVAKDNW